MPITVLTGDRFDELDVGDALAWAEETRGAFAHHMFPGGHFYLNSQLEAVLSVVERATRHRAKAPDPGLALPSRVAGANHQAAE